jgi:PIN domain nuclease of toxin-antitoxin system
MKDEGIAISAISFWEIGMLIAKARLGGTLPASDRRRLVLDRGVQELPLNGDIAAGLEDFPTAILRTASSSRRL